MEDTAFKNYPIAYIAGHGNISFNEKEVRILRDYLTSGGFLFADDDYGMDKSFRREMEKVFPELKFTEVPFHMIFIIQSILFLTGSLKYMNMMAARRKDLAYFMKED